MTLSRDSAVLWIDKVSLPFDSHLPIPSFVWLADSPGGLRGEFVSLPSGEPQSSGTPHDLYWEGLCVLCG
jgi:hypothetical protein